MDSLDTPAQGAKRVLDGDYIRNLLSGKRQLEPKAPKAPKPDDTPSEVTLSQVIKPDPLKIVQCGYEQPGDKGDIWLQWVKQHRTGAAELNERWGC